MLLPSIQFSQKDKGKITSFAFSQNTEKNNVSLDITTLKNKFNSTENIFCLGVDKFSSGKKFSKDTTNYYIGSQTSNNSGIFDTEYVLKIYYDASVKWFVIYFDTINNTFPPELYVDEQKIVLTSPIALISSKQGATTLTIKISSINKVNSPLIIRGITAYYNISSSNIKSVDFSGQDRLNTSLPSWGISTNSGSISLLDQFNFLSQANTNQADMMAKIFLGNKQICTKKATIESIDITKSAKINLSDTTIDWQKQKFPGHLNQVQPSAGNTGSRPMLTMLDIINSYANPTVEIEESDYFSSQGNRNTPTSSLLEDLKVSLPQIIEEGSVWSAYSKLCEAAMCYIYTDEMGVPKIYYDGGR